MKWGWETTLQERLEIVKECVTSAKTYRRMVVKIQNVALEQM